MTDDSDETEPPGSREENQDEHEVMTLRDQIMRQPVDEADGTFHQSQEPVAQIIAPAVDAMKDFTENAAAPLRAVQQMIIDTYLTTSGMSEAIDAMNREILSGAATAHDAMNRLAIDIVSQRSAAIAALSVPSLRDDLFGAGGAVAAMGTHFAAWSKNIEAFWAAMPKLPLRLLPPNLEGMEDVSIRAYGPVVITDGIPLYGIPRTSIAESILKAESSAERWSLLDHHSSDIAADCAALLSETTTERFRNELRLASRAADALSDRHPEAAQALAATILDCLQPTALKVAAEFTTEVLWPRKGHPEPDPSHFDHIPVRFHIGFGPLRGAFRMFNRKDATTVPTAFGRHPTVHSVHPDQFTPINGVQAVMIVTSLLYLLTELEADDDYEFE